MKVKSFTHNSKISEESFDGLLHSFLTTCIKSNKSNKSAPIEHFFRERLRRKQDRAELNRFLNQLLQATGGKTIRGINENFQESKVKPQQFVEPDIGKAVWQIYYDQVVGTETDMKKSFFKLGSVHREVADFLNLSIIDDGLILPETFIPDTLTFCKWVKDFTPASQPLSFSLESWFYVLFSVLDQEQPCNNYAPDLQHNQNAEQQEQSLPLAAQLMDAMLGHKS